MHGLHLTADLYGCACDAALLTEGDVTGKAVFAFVTDGQGNFATAVAEGEINHGCRHEKKYPFFRT